MELLFSSPDSHYLEMHSNCGLCCSEAGAWCHDNSYWADVSFEDMLMEFATQEHVRAMATVCDASAPNSPAGSCCSDGDSLGLVPRDASEGTLSGTEGTLSGTESGPDCDPGDDDDDDDDDGHSEEFKLPCSSNSSTTAVRRGSRTVPPSPPGPARKARRNRRAPRVYTCDVCGKKSGCSSNMIRHKRLHTGERPFSCRLCTMDFVNSSNRNKHEKICRMKRERRSKPY